MFGISEIHINIKVLKSYIMRKEKYGAIYYSH